MHSKMKNLLILLVLLSFGAEAQNKLPELWNMRVHDDAHVLKQETIDALEKQLEVYEDSTSNQVAILIVNTLNGEPIESFSIRLAEKWKLGTKDKDNGVLMIVAVEDHEMRIEVGHGLEGVLTDAVSSRIIRNEMAPEFRRADFDAGVTAGVNGIIAAIGGEYTADDSDSLELTWPLRLGIGLAIYGFLSIFGFFGLFIKGGWGWFMYLFLIPFYSIFPAFVFPSNLWYLPGVLFIVGFPIIKWLVGLTAWGKSLAKKFEDGSGGSGGSWSSGSGSSSSSGSSWSSSSSSSFSGGGGSFGGGGSSGSW